MTDDTGVSILRSRGVAIALPAVGAVLGMGVAIWAFRMLPADLVMEPPTVQSGDPFDPAYVGVAEVEDAAGKPPNVLFIVWDTVRADHLSLYGYERPTTPHLDRLSASAMVFEQAHSPGIWTLPAHASMFTGLPPETTGANERWLWLDSPHITMAEHFQAHGYNTFSLAANTLLSTDTNLTQGFHVPMNTFKGKMAAPSRKATEGKLLPMDRSQELAPKWTPPEHGATNAEWARASFKDAGPVIGRTFLRWTEQRKRPDTPFFAYLNLMEAHTPRIPSRASRDRVLADDPELVALGLRTDAAHINLHFYNFGKHDYTSRELEAIEGVYDATLADLDIALAELFKGLEAKELLQNTIIVLTSDHGENLGDNGLFNHRFTLAESLTHVPLVVWAPGRPGGRLRGPVTTMDLFPTLAAWAGIPVPVHLDGIHLLDAPRPAVTRMEPPLRREIETVKSVHPDVAVEPWMKSGHALVDDTLHKVVRWDSGPTMAYDLSSDPEEQRSVEVDPAAMDAVEAWRASVAPYDPSKRGPSDDPVHVRASQAELREQLNALGYTTDDD